jgi:hypothetical protein
VDLRELLQWERWNQQLMKTGQLHQDLTAMLLKERSEQCSTSSLEAYDVVRGLCLRVLAAFARLQCVSDPEYAVAMIRTMEG